jgi:hypothetical protein
MALWGCHGYLLWSSRAMCYRIVVLRSCTDAAGGNTQFYTAPVLQRHQFCYVYRFFAGIGVQASGCHVSLGPPLLNRFQGSSAFVCGVVCFACVLSPLDSCFSTSSFHCSCLFSCDVVWSTLFVGMSSRLGFASHRASASAANNLMRCCRTTSADCSCMVGGFSR